MVYDGVITNNRSIFEINNTIPGYSGIKPPDPPKVLAPTDIILLLRADYPTSFTLVNTNVINTWESIDAISGSPEGINKRFVNINSASGSPILITTNNGKKGVQTGNMNLSIPPAITCYAKDIWNKTIYFAMRSYDGLVPGEIIGFGNIYDNINSTWFLTWRGDFGGAMQFGMYNSLGEYSQAVIAYLPASNTTFTINISIDVNNLYLTANGTINNTVAHGFNLTSSPFANMMNSYSLYLFGGSGISSSIRGIIHEIRCYNSVHNSTDILAVHNEMIATWS